jgi:hypothetical protein
MTFDADDQSQTRSRSTLRSRLFFRVLVSCVMLQTGLAVLVMGRQPGNSQPLMKVLPRFSASDVPAMSKEEAETPPLALAPPPPNDLPGNGIAQHPMLYIGEGYNKILLANDGKIQWTYSTGPGWEYDDIWMLSNGNVLFTRMQYIAEITPEKKAVWCYDAPAGTPKFTLASRLAKIKFSLS